MKVIRHRFLFDSYCCLISKRFLKGGPLAGLLSAWGTKFTAGLIFDALSFPLQSCCPNTKYLGL